MNYVNHESTLSYKGRRVRLTVNWGLEEDEAPLVDDETRRAAHALALDLERADALGRAAIQHSLASKGEAHEYREELLDRELHDESHFSDLANLLSISTPEALLDDATFMRKLQVRSVAVSFGDCPAPVVLDYTLGYDLDDPSRHISDSILVVYLQHDGALCAVTTES